MAVQLESGRYLYEVHDDWAKVPDEIVLGDVAAVGVDRQNRVYAFNRGEHPVAVFDAEGNLLRTWGEGVFTRPHGVHIGPDDTIWLTDDGDHTVRKCTLDGKVLMTLGVPGEPKPYMSGEPFHRCTHTALSPQGDLYVSDGYGNARIHKYTPDGRLLKSWGEPGTDPGQFNVPHNICCDPDGWVYVADRENHRVQVFDGEGQVRDAVEQSASAERHVHGGRPQPAPLYRRGRAIGRDQPRLAQYRPARQHPHAIRARCWRGSARCMRGWRRGSSPRRTAWPSTATPTSMSANSPAAAGRASPRTPRPSACASSTNSSNSRARTIRERYRCS